MLAEYLQAAMDHAVYKHIEDGTYFGSIAELPGSWANAPTLDECVREMESVAEGWILLAIADHDELPEIDGHKLVVKASVYCHESALSSGATSSNSSSSWDSLIPAQAEATST